LIGERQTFGDSGLFRTGWFAYSESDYHTCFCQALFARFYAGAEALSSARYRKLCGVFFDRIAADAMYR